MRWGEVEVCTEGAGDARARAGLERNGEELTATAPGQDSDGDTEGGHDAVYQQFKRA